MEKVLLFAGCVTVLFVLLKILELKFIEKDIKNNLKYAMRDTIMVFSSSLVCGFVFLHYQGQLDDFFSVITNNKGVSLNKTPVFTGVPDF